MPTSLKTDTLAYQFGMRPGVLPRDMSQASIPDVVKSLNEFMDLGNMYEYIGAGSEKPEGYSGNPEVDALVFYLLNHAVSIVRKNHHAYQPLGKFLPLVERYHTELAVRSARMFFYILLICTRESRHEKHGSEMSTLYKKYGPKIATFHKDIRGTGSSGAADAFRKGELQALLGPYTEFMADTFNKGSFSGGYGGKAWGKIAEVLRDYVCGKLTAEMMEDTSFTLCHNNGPIFNKGMLFSSYSSDIYKILDVQRSGQIPELIETKGVSAASNVLVQSLYKTCKDLVGSEFGEYVDWYTVEALGSVKKYPTEKAAQTQKHGMPATAKVAQEVAKAKATVTEKAVAAANKAKIEIFPDLYITKVESPRK